MAQGSGGVGGMGRGRGLGMGGRGMGGGQAKGPNGYCVCPNCSAKVPHQRGVPCFQVKCPQCGTLMVRE